MKIVARIKATEEEIARLSTRLHETNDPLTRRDDVRLLGVMRRKLRTLRDEAGGTLA